MAMLPTFPGLLRVAQQACSAALGMGELRRRTGLSSRILKRVRCSGGFAELGRLERALHAVGLHLSAIAPDGRWGPVALAGEAVPFQPHPLQAFHDVFDVFFL